MDRAERDRGPNMDRGSIEYLRRRSLHRLWWQSASVALRRASTEGARSKPERPLPGKRV
jgi:hypothetical protein